MKNVGASFTKNMEFVAAGQNANESSGTMPFWFTSEP